ncbi:Octopine dehydrogenase [Symbiodinium microadriaticum]|uniref:Octopine dehydrogenase n=1 Tax=Symbiodinium microadriaticum TaxID=2951 RepID=A0A1Q9D1I1_SYMMI|nr:Octopine dehydrogenase [Symbiodinium microadriaticum]
MSGSDAEFTVLCCGGGNAAQVATGLFAVRYKTIAVSFFADEAAKWKDALGDAEFELTTPGGGVMKSKPKDITNDPSVAKDADLILLVVPSFAHGEYFEKFAPYMKPGTIVATMPARSGGDILFASKLGDKAKDMIFCGFETLPWACRFTEWGKKATILGTKNNILAAVTPVSATKKALAKLQGLLGVNPQVLESPNNLGISLRNPGMIVHPGVMYGRWSPESWDGNPKDEAPLFYQGVDDFTETVLTGMTDEVQLLCRKMEEVAQGLDMKDACTLKQWYLDCYDGQMKDTSSLKACMNTNAAYDGLKHPCKEVDGKFMPDLKYRYLAEDIPTGLCFAKGLAEIVGLETPTIDKVMKWGQECIGLEIMVDGKMTGKDLAKTRAPQGMGITTLEASWSNLVAVLGHYMNGDKAAVCWSSLDDPNSGLWQVAELFPGADAVAFAVHLQSGHYAQALRSVTKTSYVNVMITEMTFFIHCPAASEQLSLVVGLSDLVTNFLREDWEVLLCGIPGCGKDAVGRACVRDFPEAAALSQDEHNGSADAPMQTENASPIFVLRNGIDVGDRLPFLLPARSAGYRITAAWPAELSQSADRKDGGRSGHETLTVGEKLSKPAQVAADLHKGKALPDILDKAGVEVFDRGFEVAQEKLQAFAAARRPLPDLIRCLGLLRGSWASPARFLAAIGWGAPHTYCTSSDLNHYLEVHG